VCVIGRPEAREPEQEHALLVADGLAGLEERAREQLGVEEVGVGLTGLDAETVELGELLDGAGIGDFEAEPEIVGHLPGQSFAILAPREVVVDGVHADGLEHLGVYSSRQPRSNRVLATLPRYS
jgi:hypothetical protein